MVAGKNYKQRSPVDGWDRKPQWGRVKEKMEIHRPHHEERTKQWLQNCINLGPRGVAKTGKTKDNMERDSGERNGKSAMEELEWGTNGCSWQRWLAGLCWGLMCHMARRRYVTVTGKLSGAQLKTKVPLALLSYYAWWHIVVSVLKGLAKFLVSRTKHEKVSKGLCTLHITHMPNIANRHAMHT